MPAGAASGRCRFPASSKGVSPTAHPHSLTRGERGNENGVFLPHGFSGPGSNPAAGHAARVRVATLHAPAWQPRAPAPAFPRALRPPARPTCRREKSAVPGCSTREPQRWHSTAFRFRPSADTSSFGGASDSIAAAATAWGPRLRRRGGGSSGPPPTAPARLSQGAGSGRPRPAAQAPDCPAHARTPVDPAWLGDATALRRDHCGARDPHRSLRPADPLLRKARRRHRRWSERPRSGLRLECVTGTLLEALPARLGHSGFCRSLHLRAAVERHLAALVARLC